MLVLSSLMKTVYIAIFLLAVVAFLGYASGSRDHHKPFIPSIDVYAETHLELGYIIGSTMKDRFREYVESNEFLQRRALPFYFETGEGATIVNSFIVANKKAFPQYSEELDGMADGADISTIEVYLLNMQDALELYWMSINSTFAREKPLVAACSDVLVNPLNGTAFTGHNEDGDYIVGKFAFLEHAKVGNEPKFSAYTYPLSIPGYAYGANEHGVFISINALFPKEVVVGGLVRQFYSRALLTSTSIDDAIHKLTVEFRGRASGISVNIGSVSEPHRLVNVEVAPGDVYAVTELKPGEWLFHANMYIALNGTVEQWDDPSSDHRYARAHELPVPQDMADVQSILGDTEDKEYPIYRVGESKEDDTFTFSTVVFSPSNSTAFVHAWENPATTESLTHFSIPVW